MQLQLGLGKGQSHLTEAKNVHEKRASGDIQETRAHSVIPTAFKSALALFGENKPQPDDYKQAAKRMEVDAGRLSITTTKIRGTEGSAATKALELILDLQQQGESLRVIHSTTSRGVIIEDVNQSSYWKPKLSTARRVL